MANYLLDQTGAEVQAILNAVQNPDTTPAAGSSKLITSGGVQAALAGTAAQIGNLANLDTTAKSSLVAAVNELEAGKADQAKVSALGHDVSDIQQLLQVGEEIITPTDNKQCFYVNEDSMRVQDLSGISSPTRLNYQLSTYYVGAGNTFKVTIPKSVSFGCVVCYCSSGTLSANLQCSNKVSGLANSSAIPETTLVAPADYVFIGSDWNSADPIVVKSFPQDVITEIRGDLTDIHSDLDEIKSKIDPLAWDIMNYGLYAQIYSGKKYNASGEIVADGSYSCTNLLPLEKSRDIVPMTSGYIDVLFFDEDKEYISTTSGVYSQNPALASAFPAGAEYVAFSYNTSFLTTDVFATRPFVDSNFGEKLYSKTPKLKGERPRIYIYANDTEQVIFEKLMDAWFTRDCDVYWERGEYTLKEIYKEMYTVYGVGHARSTYEMPIGANCRYFFQNSTITGEFPTDTSYTDVKVFGNMRKGGENYELHDGTIICKSIYCVHDEGQGSDLAYTHKYFNIKMQFVSTSGTDGSGRCIGGGLGLYGDIYIEGCVFLSDNVNINLNVSYHGTTSTSGRDPMDARISCFNCWFDKGFDIDDLFMTGDAAELCYAGNSAPYNPATGNVGWTERIWQNDVRP